MRDGSATIQVDQIRKLDEATEATMGHVPANPGVLVGRQALWSIMHLAYYDEAGDDGYPECSSPLFVLTSCYIHYQNWQPAIQSLIEFRRQLKEAYGLPVKFELHARPLLLNKRPYRALLLSDDKRIEIVDEACAVIAQLPVRIANIAIVKNRISEEKYQVLDRAFTFSIQRIENDLDPTRNPEERFLIITDHGRIGVMRKTSRRLQKINYIPSKFGSESYRREIKTLIEDPLPKDSRESHFIQICDMVSYIVYLYGLVEKCGGTYGARLPKQITPERVRQWLDVLTPSLNTKAAADDAFGVRFSPKN